MAALAIVNQYNCLNDNVPNLLKHIQTFQSTSDLIFFYNSIKEATKILENAYQLVRSQRNTYGRHVPAAMICLIFSFLLPHQGGARGKMVCKNWFSALNSDLFTKIVLHRPPIRVSYLRSWSTVNPPRGFAGYHGRILCTETWCTNVNIYENLTGLWLESSPVGPGTSHLATTEDGSLMIQWSGIDNKVQVYEKKNGDNFTFYNGWSFKNCMGLSVQGQTIFLTSPTSLCGYSIDGALLWSWSLRGNRRVLPYSRKISIFQDRIFMSDKNYSCIDVFSITTGAFVCRWKIRGENQSPGGIAVLHSGVYVVNHAVNCIQVFTHDGEFLSSIYPKDPGDRFSDVCSSGDNLYVMDSKNNEIHIFQLNY